ncbi:hypothetical protein BDW75DRAFT_246085 [Aspergillus navahoensis]
MATLESPGLNIYGSGDVSPLIPRQESLWQLFLRCNPDLVKEDKVILEESANPSAKLTYGDARRKAAEGAAGLKKRLGLKAGDVIALWGSNTLSWVLAAYAGTWSGITISAINPLASAHEMVHYLHSSDAVVLFGDSSLVSRFHEAQRLDTTEKLSKIEFVSLDQEATGQSPSTLVWPRDFLGNGTEPVLDLSKADNTKFPAAICFSSGTSGKPKGVVLSHHNLLAHMLGTRCSGPEAFSRKEVEVFYAPLCHIYGMVTAVLSPAFIGHLVVIMRVFDFQNYIHVCQKKRATIMRVVPPTAMAMAKDKGLRALDLSSVHTLSCAGAALGEATQDSLQKLFNGVAVVQGYGMTEGGISALKPAYAREKSGSVGTLLPLVQMRLVDDNLKDVPPGESGEVYVSGPTNFMEYKNNPEATREAYPLGDGWLRTGDIARVDKDGFLWITDRKKELIKYKGHQVPPAELEDVLLQFPDVAEAAVCATWDESQETEIPVGYVNFKSEIDPHDRERKLKELRAFADSRVATYKKLRGGVHYLDVIPKSPTGKILRRQLPARLEMEKRAIAAKRKIKL